MRRSHLNGLVALLVGLSVLFGAGCRVKKSPTRDKVQKDALPKIELNEPWKARGALPGPVQDNWLELFDDPVLAALVAEAVR